MHRLSDYPTHAQSLDIDTLFASIGKFSNWLEKVGYETHDPYDIWGTSYGKSARRLYYSKNPVGFALVAPLLFLEIVAPRVIRSVVPKSRYATADAQLVGAFLNLHACTGNASYLDQAQSLARDLLRTAVPGFRGLCWGYPFDWQYNSGLLKRNTPFITVTPYCYEAFVRLADATSDPRHDETARSIARFVREDINDTPAGPNASAGSYSPVQHDKVINASSYRASVLVDAAHRWNLPEYRERAWNNLRFILRNQQHDGSWLYSLDNSRESFIDNFHTCFVLKSLFKINRYEQSPEIAESIRRGFAYYRDHLIDRNGRPRAFAIQPRFQFSRLEMYDFAEGITLGALLRDELPEAHRIAHHLAADLVTNFQLRAGYFVTRVYVAGFRHTYPYLRWAQAQLFHALTNFLLSISKKRVDCTPAE